MIKQVIVMRTDLNMRKGKMIAQGAHAAIECSEKARLGLFTWLHRRWNETGTTKICLSVDSEKELLEIAKQANKEGLPCVVITDEGRTEFDNVPTKTCLAIGPANAEDIDKITGKLKLL